MIDRIFFQKLIQREKDYNFAKIEKKWQKFWDKNKLYQAQNSSEKPKQYILVEFPYPSGDGLHVGHCRSYVALDVLARKRRMQGQNVLYPMGWDAFGLPTENYAIKKGIHPAKITAQNIAVFKKQLKSLGISFDWSREINTTDPKYYKWTQWIFIQLFKRGMAYQSEIPINWCPKCKIGLANEEVVQGKCERCGAQTERRQMKQWMLKITEYADRLLKELETVDYLEKIKTQQINWIGRSEGTNLKFLIKDSESEEEQFIEVFTTRVDTIYGVTALVIAPEHKMIETLKLKVKNLEEVEKYIKASQEKSDMERTDLAKEKTGVQLKGLYAINPINKKSVPIFLGDYVIAAYGGGSVMVVPAHDQRDFDFAQKYGLEIIEVIKPDQNQSAGGRTAEKGANNELLEAFESEGILINSDEFSNLTSAEARKKITERLTLEKSGGLKINYKLRDWVFSRQHYWGEPIPLVFCQKCADKIKSKKQEADCKEFNQGELLNPGWTAIEEKNLPVELPYLKKYQPSGTGESPLSKCENWIKVKCPRCGAWARRETDTMPNWAGSNWYFIRYLDSKNDKTLASPEKMKYWLPVDIYNGGMEHTTLHLLYSRYWYKFLYDIGIAENDEPYLKRRSHGMILAEDGRKMSKSFSNVINPDEIIKKYGADTLRLYEMFMGPFDQPIAWNTQTIEGVARFLARVRNLVISNSQFLISNPPAGGPNPDLERLRHQTIKKVSEDIENFKFNTTVAFLMEYLNALEKSPNILDIKTLLLLLSPITPHLCDELWQRVQTNTEATRTGTEGQHKSVLSRHKSSFGSIFQEQWPEFDPRLIQEKDFVLVVQINGKIRDSIKAQAGITEEEANQIALNSPKIQKFLNGQTIKKTIFIAGKLINLVV
ncbi:MAG: leucine--tRNA ligase [Patescibacteria group bacterium]|jgi:leucyl-tRNA synthetase